MSFTSSVDDVEVSRWRDVSLVAAARGVTSCGTFLAVTTLVLTLQPHGGYAVAALILASAAPMVALAPLTGRLVDRVDSRILLVATGTGQVATALLLVAVAEQVVAVIALMALLGAGRAVVDPTLAALTPSMVRRDDLPRASATNQTAAMAGMLTGPALAGILVGTYGVRLPLLLFAASLSALVAAGLLIRTRRGRAGRDSARSDGARSDGARSDGAGRDGDPPSPEAASAAGWSLWRDPMLRTMVVSLGAVVAAIGAINVVEVFFIRGTLNASASAYGMLEATWTAGMLAGTWLLARAARRARDDGALVLGLLAVLGVLCVTFPVAATVGAAGYLVPLWLVGGGCNGGLNVYTSVLSARRTPERFRGRTYATFVATVNGAAMAGYVIGGPLVEIVPTRPLVAGIGLAGLAVVGLLAPTVARSVRNERATAG